MYIYCLKMVSLDVLIIDDDTTQLEVMSEYLTDFDPELKISTATTHKEALLKISDETFDCLVLDHSMPDGIGLELAKKIRETSRVPIILYTGHGSEELASSSRDYGVDDYLRKDPDPIHYETLAKRIRLSSERHKLEELARTQFFYEKDFKLPEYPVVDVRGRSIYIIHEDGREELWGEENRRSQALKTAKEIELGLRAIKYGKDYLARSLNELMLDFMDLGIPVEYIDSIIEKGYSDLTDLLKKLEYMKQFPDENK